MQAIFVFSLFSWTWATVYSAQVDSKTKSKYLSTKNFYSVLINAIYSSRAIWLCEIFLPCATFVHAFRIPMAESKCWVEFLAHGYEWDCEAGLMILVAGSSAVQAHVCFDGLAWIQRGDLGVRAGAVRPGGATQGNGQHYCQLCTLAQAAAVIRPIIGFQ